MIHVYLIECPVCNMHKAIAVVVDEWHFLVKILRAVVWGWVEREGWFQHLILVQQLLREEPTVCNLVAYSETHLGVH